ncbi:hypothetical protein GCM10009839_17630 [Catenulispora yoronensis]|uniref:Uncharacterized protein n=1 Tax=Catenulispora yoronensis TaxID=450799 RepID=A0ABP5F973_9ACTN
MAPGPLHDLKALLHRLHAEAGGPSAEVIASRIAEAADNEDWSGCPSADTVWRVLTKPELPANQADAVAVAVALSRMAGGWDASGPGGGDVGARVRRLWAQARLAPAESLRTIGGWDPIALRVHRSITAGAGRGAAEPLTEYFERDHDRVLRARLREAAAGAAVLAVLTGQSSTGKTRALYEAVAEQLPDWPVLVPPDAATLIEWIRQDAIEPSTVLWLNETQNFLPAAAEALAGLLKRIRPLVVIGATWNEYWHRLDTNAQPGQPDAPALEHARMLLATHQPRIQVPAEFTPEQIKALAPLADRDGRLRAAARAAGNSGRIIQHLTGGPKLLQHYLDGDDGVFSPLELAVITAALDARQLGHASPIPAALLAEAAAGYPSAHDRVHPDPDWIHTVLDGICHDPRTRVDGALTALSKVRLGPGIGPAQGYEPADYLDQHTRRLRADCYGTPALWTALIEHTSDRDDQERLAQAAWDRDLRTTAVRLWHKAAAAGHPTTSLAQLDTVLDPDRYAAAYSAANADLADPYAVARLLEALREVGAEQAVTTLLARDPAAHADVTNPVAAALLLDALWEAGAEQAVRVLADRTAVHVTVADTYHVSRLLLAFRETGAEQAVTVLAERVAAHADPTDPKQVARLLQALREARAEQAVRMLADRTAPYADFTDPDLVSQLLQAFRDARVERAVTELADRAATHVDCAATSMVSRLLLAFRDVGAEQAVRLLADRVAAHADLTKPNTVADLLQVLREAGAEQAVAALLARDPAAHADLTDPYSVARLLQQLREAGAKPAVKVLADRAAANADLTDPRAVTQMLRVLWMAGAGQGVMDLVDRAVAHIDFTDSDPDTVARLLGAFQDVGAEQAVRVLADRAAANADLTDPQAVAQLLLSLQEDGAELAVRVLADHAAAHADLTDLEAVERFLWTFREAGANHAAALLADRVIAQVDLADLAGLADIADPGKAARLLTKSQRAGAKQAVVTLGQRSKVAGRHPGHFVPYGREPDGRPSPPWTARSITSA